MGELLVGGSILAAFFAGGVALSVTLAFAVTPQMFALTLPRQNRFRPCAVLIPPPRRRAPDP